MRIASQEVERLDHQIDQSEEALKERKAKEAAEETAEVDTIPKTAQTTAAVQGYQIGQEVEAKNKADKQWRKGKVTKTSPLEVKCQSDWWSYSYDQVRTTEEAGEEKKEVIEPRQQAKSRSCTLCKG